MQLAASVSTLIYIDVEESVVSIPQSEVDSGGR